MIEKEHIERELQVAAEIQLSILPDQLPSVEGFDFGARILPACHVGGDFYDVFENGAIESALSLGMWPIKASHPQYSWRGLMRSSWRKRDAGLPPGAVLDLVNRHITHLEKSTQFVTALYGILNSVTGEFSYACAGHEPPLILFPDGKVQRVPHGPEWRLDFGMRSRSMNTPLCLHRTARSVLFTDGLTDCRDPNGVAFGLERIKATLSGLVGLSAQQVCDKLFDTLMSYQSGAKQDDDVTLVAIHAAGK